MPPHQYDLDVYESDDESNAAGLVTVNSCPALLEDDFFLEAAAEELEALRRREAEAQEELIACSQSQLPSPRAVYEPFPPACLEMVHRLSGNDRCVDCGSLSRKPDWASVSYGALICLQCSGAHRGMGVRRSIVRSITMDSWSSSQVLAMLEGGNGQLESFFERHSLSAGDSAPFMQTDRVHHNNRGNFGGVSVMRYRTKAALFYREQLALHTEKVALSGRYRGRKATR